MTQAQDIALDVIGARETYGWGRFRFLMFTTWEDILWAMRQRPDLVERMRVDFDCPEHAYLLSLCARYDAVMASEAVNSVLGESK